MYNAWTGEHSKGKKGTTCLHMDIADAVNILLYTADMESHQRAAQWDIFRAEDADAIRQFLVERYPDVATHGDPIHAQIHYLDDDALQELYLEKGVYSWRIMQEAGQAVFIPAGCAHQVCNLTDCIKVAVDFISPQNVARCFQLTEEFRSLTVEGKKSWKEDILQLKAQLWYAWSACRGIGKAPSEEEINREVANRVERAKQKELEEEERARSQKKKEGAFFGEVYSARPTGNTRGSGVRPEGEVATEREQFQLRQLEVAGETTIDHTVGKDKAMIANNTIETPSQESANELLLPATLGEEIVIKQEGEPLERLNLEIKRDSSAAVIESNTIEQEEKEPQREEKLPSPIITADLEVEKPVKDMDGIGEELSDSRVDMGELDEDLRRPLNLVTMM